MSRTQNTRKGIAPKKIALQRERVKEHPYNDVTAAWLREDADALDTLRDFQTKHNAEVRKLQARHAEAWLNYCREASAPQAVVKQAEANFKLAEGRVNA